MPDANASRASAAGRTSKFASSRLTHQRGVDRARHPPVERGQPQPVERVGHAQHAAAGVAPGAGPHLEAGGHPVVPVGDVVGGGAQLPAQLVGLRALGDPPHGVARAVGPVDVAGRRQLGRPRQRRSHHRSGPVQRAHQLHPLRHRREVPRQPVDPVRLHRLVAQHPAVEERLGRDVADDADVLAVRRALPVDVERRGHRLVGVRAHQREAPTARRPRPPTWRRPPRRRPPRGPANRRTGVRRPRSLRSSAEFE